MKIDTTTGGLIMNSKSYIYFIDAANNIMRDDGVVESVDLEKYLSKVVDNISVNLGNYKEYKEAGPSTPPVLTYIKDIVLLLDSNENNTDQEYLDLEKDFFDRIAQQLYLAELDVQSNIDRLHKNVKYGTLILSCIKTSEDEVKFIIMKLEHINVITDVDYKLQNAFSTDIKKQELKLCVMTISSDDGEFDIESIFVSEKSKSDYWTGRFLRVIEMTTASKDTSDAIKEINSILRNIKKNAPEDYPEIQSSVTGYFSTHSRFNHQQFWDEIFENYIDNHPDTRLDIKEIKKKYSSKLASNKLPGEFDIDHKIVTQRMIKKTYALNKHFQIRRIKNHQDDSEEMNKEVIKIIKDQGDDNYYLKILIENNKIDKVRMFDYDNVVEQD